MASQIMEQVRMMMGQQAKAGLLLPKDGDVTLPRKTVEENSKRMPVMPGVDIRAGEVDGVTYEVVSAGKPKTGDLVFYIHGGAWTAGNAESSRGFASMLAVDLGCRVATISYHLAPEYQYPTQLNECAAVYLELVRANPGSRIALIGESAGGHLILALTHYLLREGLPLPVSVTAYSPMVDCTGALYEEREKNRATDVVVGNSGIVLDDLARGLCFGECRADDPTVSPLQGDFKAFPPLCLTADEDEMLYADYRALKEKAQAAGVSVTARSWPGCFHAFPTMGRACPESAEAYEVSLEFIRTQFA